MCLDFNIFLFIALVGWYNTMKLIVQMRWSELEFVIVDVWISSELLSGTSSALYISLSVIFIS
jgi:hypothetical protein